MSARTERFSAILSRTHRKNRARPGRPIQQEAKELFQEGKVGRRTGEAAAKPKSERAAAGAMGKGRSGARAVDRDTGDVLARLDSDVEMNSAVARGRSKAVSPDLTARERKIEGAKRAAADNPKSVNAVLSFGLERQQARTLDQMLGQLFGQPVKLVGSAELRKARAAANKLIAAMKAHWDAALLKGETREAVLGSAFDRLKAELKRTPDLNRSRFIRQKLFDPWRRRFMKRLGSDRALAAELRAATGVEILTDSDVPKFSLKLQIGENEARLGLDVDHAETRLSDAVRAARRPDDLLSVIDSEGMQLLLPWENRVEIEALRKATREYFDNADEAAVDYFRRSGVSAAALNREIDEMIATLERTVDSIP